MFRYWIATFTLRRPHSQGARSCSPSVSILRLFEGEERECVCLESYSYFVIQFVQSHRDTIQRNRRSTRSQCILLSAQRQMGSWTDGSRSNYLRLTSSLASILSLWDDGRKTEAGFTLALLYGTSPLPFSRMSHRANVIVMIRIATDLNLHQISTVKPKSEAQEREILNQTRLWLNCYNLDRSTATQFGKPSTIKED